MCPCQSWLKTKYKFLALILVLGFSGWLSACSGWSPVGPAPDSFIPPAPSPGTPVPAFYSPGFETTSPTPTRQVETPRPTPTQACTDILGFLEDLTIPDGTLAGPGVQLDKQWRVINNGSCNWDDRYRLKLVSGDAMGVIPEQALYPARGGSELVIRMVFTSPQEPGTYRSAWQAYSPQDEPFGDPFYIEIVVEAPTS